MCITQLCTVNCDKMCVLWLFAVLLTINSSNASDGKAYKLPLNDGNSIPTLGLGTFLGFDTSGQKQPQGEEVEQAVTWALQAGYRMIDTASLYLNEEFVGKGVRKSGVPREEVFIVTKLGMNEKRDVVAALRNSLARLNMSYVDLYLIHNPISYLPDNSGYEVIDYVDTWKGMEEVKRLGLAKSIGVSNFNVSQMERLLENCEIKPSVLQVEVNLNLAQNELIELCNRHGIEVMAYTPFGSLFYFRPRPDAPPPALDDPFMVSLSTKYGKTVPQVILRYLVQRGIVPIPKSTKKNRIEENIDVFDFQLSEEEMKSLSNFNKDYRTVYPSFWQDHPYYPFPKVDKPDTSPFGEPKE